MRCQRTGQVQRLPCTTLFRLQGRGEVFIARVKMSTLKSCHPGFSTVTITLLTLFKLNKLVFNKVVIINTNNYLMMILPSANAFILLRKAKKENNLTVQIILLRIFRVNWRAMRWSGRKNTCAARRMRKRKKAPAAGGGPRVSHATAP